MDTFPIAYAALQAGRRTVQRGTDRWTQGNLHARQVRPHAAQSNAALIDGHPKFLDCPDAFNRRTVQRGTDRWTLEATIRWCAERLAAQSNAALIDGHSTGTRDQKAARM